MKLSLLKYLTLLLALIFTIGYLFYGKPNASILTVLQIALGGNYVLLSILEFTRQLNKALLPSDRFSYFPLSFLSAKLIKLGAFGLASTILFLSTNGLIFLGGLLLIVMIADVLVFALRVSKKVYYVSLFANYVLFSLENEQQVFASQVKVVEFRYNIFYLTLNNGKNYTLQIDRIEKEKQKLFAEKMVLWVISNNLKFTDEAKAKLVDIISATN